MISANIELDRRVARRTAQLEALAREKDEALARLEAVLDQIPAAIVIADAESRQGGRGERARGCTRASGRWRGERDRHVVDARVPYRRKALRARRASAHASALLRRGGRGIRDRVRPARRDARAVRNERSADPERGGGRRGRGCRVLGPDGAHAPDPGRARVRHQRRARAADAARGPRERDRGSPVGREGGPGPAGAFSRPHRAAVRAPPATRPRAPPARARADAPGDPEARGDRGRSRCSRRSRRSGPPDGRGSRRAARPSTRVVANRELAEQALLNLVSNAAKYAPEGEIVLRGRSDNGRVALEVADSGPGMTRRAAVTRSRAVLPRPGRRRRLRPRPLDRAPGGRGARRRAPAGEQRPARDQGESPPPVGERTMADARARGRGRGRRSQTPSPMRSRARASRSTGPSTARRRSSAPGRRSTSSSSSTCGCRR